MIRQPVTDPAAVMTHFASAVPSTFASRASRGYMTDALPETITGRLIPSPNGITAAGAAGAAVGAADGSAEGATTAATAVADGAAVASAVTTAVGRSALATGVTLVSI